MKTILNLTLAALVLIGSHEISSAAVISINETVDISGFGSFMPISSGARTVSVGDTIEMTVNFTERLSFTTIDNTDSRPGNFFLDLISTTQTNDRTVSDNGTFEFFDYVGEPEFGPVINAVDPLDGPFGATTGSFLPVGETISMTGFRATFDIATLEPNSYTFDRFRLSPLRMDITAAGTAAVPEPGPMALLALCGLGGAGYRRRKKSAAKLQQSV